MILISPVVCTTPDPNADEQEGTEADERPPNDVWKIQKETQANNFVRTLVHPAIVNRGVVRIGVEHHAAISYQTPWIKTQTTKAHGSVRKSARHIRIP